MTRLPVILFSIILFVAGCRPISDNRSPKPAPTELHQGDEAGNKNARQDWIELMHQTAPGTSWRQLEYENAMQIHQNRQSAQLHDELESLADGQLAGYWYERGSKNQAGSVFETLYDSEADKIYTVSSGGTLWRGDRDDNDWEVVNQDLRFSRWMLEWVTLPSGAKRMLALVNRVPHYSDDKGATWQAATGGIVANDSWGGVGSNVVIDENQNIICLAKSGFFADYNLYLSTDLGESYQPIQNLYSSDSDLFALAKSPKGSTAIFITKYSDTQARVSKWNPDELVFEDIGFPEGVDFEAQPANLTIYESDTELRMYAYGGTNMAHVRMSQDTGMTWTVLGQFPEMPWAVGMYVSPSNPDVLLAGGLHCYKSLNGGVNWTLQNEWWEYYGDVEGKLHADMMTFREFETADGTPFLLISNHGGLSISYDNLNTVSNIGELNLNVAEIYDVRTDPTDGLTIYAGTQDQGFQRGIGLPTDETIHMEQVISGDYGHLAFSLNGQSLWITYPGGSISYYDQPQTGYSSAYYDLNAENESVWIPPLMDSPNPAFDAVYLAGGSATGGSGSYIIQLVQQGGTINATNLPLDFRAESGGEVSALESSPLDANHWYAATTNGRFFHSADYGQSWDQALNFLPEGHYLYGQAILPSKMEQNKVYFGGSGYNNPSVYVSNDYGANFQAMDAGLPPTLVFGLAANADESMIFAATEAGPYVYITADNRWYSMHGTAAPVNTYWSVAFLENQNLVRFGTHGRGIWDFQIEDVTSIVNTAPSFIELKAYPNPTTARLSIDLPSNFGGPAQVNLYNHTGQLVKSTQTDETTVTMDVQGVPKGLYVVEVETENGEWRGKAKVVVQ